jgi:hypothetical protein
MGRFESIASPIPPGAGRIRDLNFPDYTTAGAGSLPNLRCRITGASFGGVQNNFTGLTTSWVFFQGLDAYQLVSSAGGGTGGSFSWLNNVNVNVRTSAVNHWPLDDDWNVHRMVWIACINGAITTDNDMGPQLLSSSTQTQGILRTPQNGLGFRFATGGKFNFIARNVANGLSEVTLATDGVGGYHVTDWHSYDLRLFSALPNQPPFLKILIDDVLVQTITWAGGTLPANGESGAGICGFFPTLICNSANTAGMFTKLLSFQAAPTEAATF